jgi:hypothetical protein
MTWPTGAVNTTNTDADTDSPLSARTDILDLMQKFNQVQAHATSVGQSLLSATDAAAGRSTLSAAPLASPSFSGTPSVPTASAGTNTTQAASTAYATAADVIVQAAAASDATTKANAALASALSADSAKFDIPVATTGSVQVNANDAEVTLGTGIGYTKLKETMVPYGGVFNVYFEQHSTFGGTNVQIRVNGTTAVTNSNNTATYVAYNYDVTVPTGGGTVELWLSTSGVQDCFVQNFRIRESDPKTVFVNTLE